VVQGYLKVVLSLQTGPQAGLFWYAGGFFAGVAGEKSTGIPLNAP